ncbi:hypothetical protein CEP48_00370 [Mergibacter septicus]|uniref:Uncharacterized protein n=1 Tax=Mergibacter septicus TaxID=221402 RepID=A0A8E3SCI5_9PAST|nr:hypothetical protein [Mergibacter septicus]AWX14735.1 hypothetical protein CEP47_00370 [Mergibacter septicus]QDJ13986.1 hypothetical protein CEP48_00370 [Mergibacter septicus]UTU48565.1 hypothetical protein HLL31_07260 [Mergibacter septicus]WMR95806.1 hypothetical protein RDJ12_07740 [Mergibacter septicus]
MIIQFDKHRFIKGLSRDNLYTLEQAERMAEELDGALSQSQRMLATKEDIAVVKAEIAEVRSEMKAMEFRLESAITKSQNRLILIIGSMMVGFITILPYLQKLHF